MGLYSRDYYREISASPWGFDGAPVVKWVVVLNVVAFPLPTFAPPPPQISEAELRDRFAARKDQAPPTDEEMHEIMRASVRTSVVQEWGELDTQKTVFGG